MRALLLAACLGTALAADESAGQGDWRAIRLSGPGLRFLSGLAISPDERRALAVLGNEADGYEASVLDLAQGKEARRLRLPLVLSADDALWGKSVVVVAGQTGTREPQSSVLLLAPGQLTAPERGPGQPRPPGWPAFATVPLQTQSASGPVASYRARLALSADEGWLAAVSVPADPGRTSWDDERGAVAVIDVKRGGVHLLAVPGTRRCVAPLFTQRSVLELGSACLALEGGARWHVFQRRKGAWAPARTTALSVPEGVLLKGETARAARDAAGNLWIAWALRPGGLLQQVTEEGPKARVRSVACAFLPEQIHPLRKGMVVLAADGSAHEIAGSADGPLPDTVPALPAPVKPLDETVPGARPVFSPSGRLVLAGMHALTEPGYESPVLSIARLPGPPAPVRKGRE